MSSAALLGYTLFVLNAAQLDQLGGLFSRHPAVKLAYLFGSAASGEAGPLSDYDFAVYLDPLEKGDIVLTLITELSHLLSTDRIDLVILNKAGNTELKYEIIASGQLIYEVEPYRVLIEPLIMNEYFDFRILLHRHELTQVDP